MQKMCAALEYEKLLKRKFMISKLIKRIFGKGKEDFAPVTNQKETENDNLFFDRVFILHKPRRRLWQSPGSML